MPDDHLASLGPGVLRTGIVGQVEQGALQAFAIAQHPRGPGRADVAQRHVVRLSYLAQAHDHRFDRGLDVDRLAHRGGPGGFQAREPTQVVRQRSQPASSASMMA